ncbi:MAG: bifunctional phosphoribosyl-AMP cyclohydrolase/phosphoribosyl-ATP diphosphatase [Candidatus Rokuibacteriota bacterium]|nr:MAG: bifunctional phosphoribosyl-AMP cyclohydrolase/phosphoribosyl-ATP diphosphatase [Candidatus Rokubacteria bacterium]
MTIDDLAFDSRGLVPAVVQDADTGTVLTLAWMNREAVERTLTTGLVHFWSRSRQTLWRKGETSGHVQHVVRIHVDCDADAVLVQVHPEGPACHTGNPSCFYRRFDERGAPTDTMPTANMLERLEEIIRSRKSAPPAGSYVATLLGKGEPAICRKIGEEAIEVVTAALGGEGDLRVVAEVADLWFHTLVLLGARGIPLREVLAELASRHVARGSPSS